MATDQTTEPIRRKPLRVWPGVVAAVLLLLARFGLKAVIPGFRGFELGMMWGFGGALAVLVWWALFSRARWFERVGAIALMIAALAGSWQLKHESMGPLWLIGYAVPGACLALVAGAAAGRRLADGPRRATIAAAIVAGCGAWTLVRTEGVSGDMVSTFRWRFVTTAEQRLLAQAQREPRAGSAAPAATATQATKTEAERTEPAVAPAAGAKAATPEPSVAPVEAPALTLRQAQGHPERSRGASERIVTRVEGRVEALGEWPGFRGPGRDGVVRGAHVETDWANSPPIRLWRRPIGPGWSSFAVLGNLLYTQEQRGPDEVVACYRATTGEPVWIHRDPVRFVESNAGAGPRATPTLSNGRVYTFGATGILNALDAGSGAVVWSHDAASDTDGIPSMIGGRAKVPDWGFSSSPLVVGDAVIIAAAGQLLAYDAATGNPRWAGPAGGMGYSSPQLATIDDVAQVLLLSGAGARSFAPADGKQLWEHAWRGMPIVQPALLADGDILIAVGDGSGTRRLTVAHDSGGWTVKERWTSRGLKPNFNDFVVHKGHAFGFDGSILACIDLADGARKWKGGRYGNGQLVLLPDQDLLLVLSEEGELALVRATPDAFTELAHVPAISGKTWNHPALVGDVLLVRNGAEMAAFRLSAARRDAVSDSAGR